MGEDRLSSLLGSLCLHLGLAALILLWPASEAPLRDPKPSLVYMGQVTIGKEGKFEPHAKRSEPGPAAKKEVRPVEKKNEEPKPEVKPVPAKDVAKDEPPRVKPVEKREPDAVPIAKDTTPQKKVQNATAQKDVPKKNATAPVKTTKNATAPVKKEDSLKNALADLEKKTGKASGKSTGGGKKGGGSLSSALDNLGKELGGSGNDASGTGPGGSGGDGVGLLGAYGESVVSRVKPNWQWAVRADRKNYSAEVRVKVGSDGSILEATLKRSSGNTLFDASVLRAIRATVNLEPPPKGVQDVEVYFDSSMLQ